MPFVAPESDLEAPSGVNAFGDPILGGTRQSVRQAKDIGDSIISGLQNSSLGLAVRGKLPDMQLGADAPWYHRAAAGLGGIAGDAPAMVAGGYLGMSAGGATGAAVSGGNPLVAAGGVLVGGGAGSFALPMAIREGLIAAYNSNHAASWEGVMDIALASLKGGGKGALIGGATAGAGGLATRVVGGVVAPTVGVSLTGQAAVRTAEAAGLGAELATLTGTAAALEGHMPTWQDFMDNAILLGGMKGAVAIAKGMRNTYAETGRSPEQILADATKDPEIKAALEAGKLPKAYEPQALAERIRAAFDTAEAKPEQLRQSLDNLSPGSNTPKLNGNLLTDPVKYEYITDSATAAGVLRGVTEAYSDLIAKQTRGEVPNKQTASEALKMIAGGDVSQRVIGEAANAAEIYARAHLLKGATNHAISELAKIADIPAEELTPSMKLQALASLERVGMLKAELEGVGAEAGRALQILGQIKRDPSFLGEADGLLKAAERKGNLQDIARFAAGLKEPSQLAEFARKYTQATTTQKFIEGWRAAIFSGPLTWQANIMGNIAKWAIEVPESTVSATITAARQAIKGDPMSVAQYKARALAPLYGAQRAALDGLLLAKEGKALVEANGTLPAVKEIMKRTADTLLREDDKIDVHQRANEGVPGALVGAAFGMLKLQDMPFRTVGERAETHIIAVDRAIKEGFHPDSREFRNAVETYMQNPTQGLEGKAALAVEKRIAGAGAEAVFSQRLGPTTEKLSSAISGTPWEFLFPARRTPANLLSWAVQHTPVLNFFSGRWREDFKAGGERGDKAVARVVVGTALAATALGLAQQGVLTGGGLFDKEESGTKAGAGWQPYSLKLGDTYYSIQRIEPVAKLMMLTGDLHEILNSPKLGPDDKGKAVAMLTLAFGNATLSTTYLSGLSNAMRAALDPERYGEALIESYATSLVPKIIGQPVTMADPLKREVDGALDAIQSQLPFLREKLLPKRDVWGEPSQNDRWFDVMPVATSKESQEKVKTEAMKLHVAIAPAPKFVMERGPFSQREQRIELKPEQRDILKEVSGTWAMNQLAPIVNSPDWERIPQFAQVKIYQNIIEDARKLGANAALPPDAATRENMRRKIVDKVIQQTSEVGTTEKRIKAE